MRRLLVLFTALVTPAVAAQPCPVEGAPVSVCAEVTLVALADQAEALGLTQAQVDTIETIRARDLHAVHDILGDLQSLGEALHDLDQPFDAAEVFALFYEIARHEDELRQTFLGAEAALLDVLTPAQRLRWIETLTAAAAIHEPGDARTMRGDKGARRIDLASGKTMPADDERALPPQRRARPSAGGKARRSRTEEGLVSVGECPTISG